MKTAAWILLSAACLAFPAAAETRSRACAEGQTLAGGPIDETVFARDASRGVRAEWCERYDALGRAVRVGLYRERYPDGGVRLVARYVDGRLTGPLVAYHEDGAVFLRGELAAGRWRGRLSLHHPNGELFWTGAFEDGRLDGRVELRHPDGGLAAEMRFQNGREDGPARSFYPAARGGGVQSEVHVEADALVGIHRVFDADGHVRLQADRDRAPASWPTAQPVATPAGGDETPTAPRRAQGTRPSANERSPAAGICDPR